MCFEITCNMVKNKAEENSNTTLAESQLIRKGSKVTGIVLSEAITLAYGFLVGIWEGMKWHFKAWNAFGKVSSFLSPRAGKVLEDVGAWGGGTNSPCTKMLVQINRMPHTRDDSTPKSHPHTAPRSGSQKILWIKVLALTGRSAHPNFLFLIPQLFSPPCPSRVLDVMLLKHFWVHGSPGDLVKCRSWCHRWGLGFCISDKSWMKQTDPAAPQFKQHPGPRPTSWEAAPVQIRDLPNLRRCRLKVLQGTLNKMHHCSHANW